MNHKLLALQQLIRRGDQPAADPRSLTGTFLSGDLAAGAFTATQLDAFLRTPADTDVAAAEAVSAATARIQVPDLASDQRSTESLAVNKGLLECDTDVLTALQRGGEVARRCQVSPEGLRARMTQGDALTSFNRCLDDSIRRVADGRLIVEACQQRLRQIVWSAILSDLLDPFQDAAEKRQLLVDAAPILEEEEKRLKQMRAERKKNAAGKAGLQEQIHDVQQETLLITTLRNLRSGVIPDAATLQAAAAYYVSR